MLNDNKIKENARGVLFWEILLRGVKTAYSNSSFLPKHTKWPRKWNEETMNTFQLGILDFDKNEWHSS